MGLVKIKSDDEFHWGGAAASFRQNQGIFVEASSFISSTAGQAFLRVLVRGRHFHRLGSDTEA